MGPKRPGTVNPPESHAASSGGSFIDLAVYGFVAGIAGIACLLWATADAWWPGTLLLFGPRWLIGLPLPVLVALSLSDPRRRLLTLAFGAGVFLFFILGVRGSLPTTATGDLRVVTLNVAHRDLSVSLDHALATWDADVVAFQECTGPLAPKVDALVGLAVHRAGGLCLISKLPIRKTAQMTRSSFDAVGGAGWAVRYELETPSGAPLHLMNLHLGTPRDGLWEIRYGDFSTGVEALRRSRELRTAESERARRWLDHVPAGRVALGDFNAPVESRIYRAFWGDLVNAHGTSGLGTGYTRFNGWIRARIDHVLTDGDWRPIRAVVGEDVGSDHRPLIVDLVTNGT